jgi:hypothetical protein
MSEKSAVQLSLSKLNNGYIYGCFSDVSLTLIDLKLIIDTLIEKKISATDEIRAMMLNIYQYDLRSALYITARSSLITLIAAENYVSNAIDDVARAAYNSVCEGSGIDSDYTSRINASDAAADAYYAARDNVSSDSNAYYSALDTSLDNATKALSDIYSCDAPNVYDGSTATAALYDIEDYARIIDAANIYKFIMEIPEETGIDLKDRHLALSKASIQYTKKMSQIEKISLVRLVKSYNIESTHQYWYVTQMFSINPHKIQLQDILDETQSFEDTLEKTRKSLPGLFMNEVFTS